MATPGIEPTSEKGWLDLAFKSSNAAARAAHIRWSKVTDRTEETRVAREAALAKMASEVDPDQQMSARDRQRAIRNLQAAHMLLVSERGVAARQRKRAQLKKSADGTDSAGDL